MTYIDFCDKHIDDFYRMAFAVFCSSEKAAEAVERACFIGSKNFFRKNERIFAVKMFGILYSVCAEMLEDNGKPGNRAAIALRFASGLRRKEVAKAFGKDIGDFYKIV